MGIRGLTGWIRWVALKTLKAPDWKSYKNKRIGIDILGFIYKAKANNVNPIKYIAQLIAQCRKYNMIPIPIFDGKVPDEKKDTIRLRSETRKRSDKKRQQLMIDIENESMSEEQRKILMKEVNLLTMSSIYVTTEERDEVKKLLYAAGVLFMNANGEADNVLAYMARKGQLDAVMTNDMDLLARGVNNLLVPKGLAAIGDNNEWVSYNLTSILKEAGINYSQFLDMCVLMGSDYTNHKLSLRFIESYNVIKYKGNLQHFLKIMNVKDTSCYEKALNILKGVYDNIEELLNEKQLIKWDLWTKGDKDSFKTEQFYLEELRSEQLKDMDDYDYKLLYHSDILTV